MGAAAADQAVLAVGLAEEDEVLAEEAHRHDRALVLQLADERRGLPVRAHEPAARRAGPVCVSRSLSSRDSTSAPDPKVANMDPILLRSGTHAHPHRPRPDRPRGARPDLHARAPPQRPPRVVQALGRAAARRRGAPRMLGYLRWNALSVPDNLVLDDPEDTIDELRGVQAAGGGAVVDLTLQGMGRRLAELPRISRESGVTICVGCGWYVEEVHPTGDRRPGCGRARRPHPRRSPRRHRRHRHPPRAHRRDRHEPPADARRSGATSARPAARAPSRAPQ